MIAYIACLIVSGLWAIRECCRRDAFWSMMFGFSTGALFIAVVKALVEQ